MYTPTWRNLQTIGPSDLGGDPQAGLPPADGVHKGLTKAALVKQLWESLKAGQRGAFLPDLKALRGGKKPKKIPLAPPIKRKVVFPPPPHDVTIESLIESKME